MFPTICPTCDARRVGAFRFCRSCGFDFDAAAATHASVPPTVGQPAREPDATPTQDRGGAARSSLPGLVNALWVICGAIGGAVGVSILVGLNGDPLETLAGVFLVAPVAGGYVGHLVFLALWGRG
jgi:hypothetical protein